MSEINKEDLIESGIDAEFKKVSTAINEVVESLNAVISTSAQLNSSLKGAAASQQSVITASGQAAANNQKLASASAQLNDITIKRIKTDSDYFKSLQKLTAQKDNEQKADEKRKKTIDAEAGSINALKQKIKELTNERNALGNATGSNAARVQALNDEINENNALLKKSQSLEEQRVSNIGKYKEALEGLGGPIARLKQGFDLLAKNPFIAVMGALVALFFALKEAMQRSEEGQDKLAKAMEVLNAVFGVFMDIVGEIAIFLVDAFTKPKQAISDLWAFLKQNLINRLTSFQELLGALGDTIVAVFSLDSDAIVANAKKAGNAFIDMNTGVKGTLDKLSAAYDDLGNRISNAADKAKLAADAADAAGDYQRENLTKIARLEGQIADKRLKLAELNKSDIQGSIKLTKEILKLEEKKLEMKAKEASMNRNAIVLKSEEGANTDEMNTKVQEAYAAEIEAQNALKQARAENQTEINKLYKFLKAQINDTAASEIEAAKATAEAAKTKNDEIIGSTAAIEDKMSAIQDSEYKLINAQIESYDIQYSAYKKMLDNKLISQEQFDADVLALDATTQANITKITTEATKQRTGVTVKEQKRMYDEGLKLVENEQIKEINAIKKAYVNKQITAEEAESQIQAIQKDTVDKQITNLETMIASEQFSAEQRASLEVMLFDLKQKLAEEEVKALEDTAQKKKALNDSYVSAAQQGIGAIFDLSASYRERDLADIDKKQAYEMKLAGDNAAAKEGIEKKFDAQRKVILRKQAEADKRKAIFEAVIAAALSVVKAAPVVPLMAAMAIIGAIQVAAIASKPIPQFHDGVKDFAGGLAVVGDGGREIIETPDGIFLAEKEQVLNLPEHSNVYTTKETNKMINKYSDESVMLLASEMAALRNVVANKEDVRINIDQHGLRVLRGVNDRNNKRLNDLVR